MAAPPNCGSYVATCRRHVEALRGGRYVKADGAEGLNMIPWSLTETARDRTTGQRGIEFLMERLTEKFFDKRPSVILKFETSSQYSMPAGAAMNNTTTR